MAPRLLLRIVLGAAVLIAVVSAARPGSPLAVAGRDDPYPRATAAAAAATFTFAPGVDPLNQKAWLDAVARARPEARVLFDRVDGLVTVEDAEPPDGALGVTIPQGDRYVIRFRFGPVFHELGRRGFDRLVDHELGHVVDFALLDDGIRARLDAGIPPGQPCPAGTRSGSCAPREERFAESFAKWASGDLGIALYAGYAVPPPPDLEAWGAPLAAVAPPA